MDIKEIHRIKTGNIAQAKKIWDIRCGEIDDPKKATIEYAVTQGMFKLKDLKDNMLYYGYSLKTTEAVWNAKKKFFVALLGGMPLSLKYFNNFIPTTSEEQIQETMPKTKEELFNELMKTSIEIEKTSDIMKGAKIRYDVATQEYTLILKQIDKLIRKEIKK